MFIFLIVVAVFFLIIIFGKILKAKQENKTFSSKYIMAEEIPELLRFTHYDTEIWKERLKFVHEKLNYRKLEELLEYLSIEEYVTYEKKVGFQLIHREEFFQIYQQILEILDVENQVEKKNLIFLQEKNQGEWLTQEGTFSTHFMEDRNCFFKEFQTYQVYCIQGEIIGVRKPYEDSLRWKNVFVHQMKDGKIQILYENQLISWEIGELEENIQNTICDFCFVCAC